MTGRERDLVRTVRDLTVRLRQVEEEREELLAEIDRLQWIGRLRLHRNPVGSACGTVAGYKSGCRCRPCRDANTDYQRRYRARVSAPTGTSG